MTEEESRLDGRSMKERPWLAVVDYCPFRSAALSASNGNSDKKPIPRERREQNDFINLPATVTKTSLVLQSGARKSTHNAVCSLRL